MQIFSSGNICTFTEIRCMISSRSSQNQVNIECTFNHSLKQVWDFLFSKKGLVIWLGTWELDKWETGITFTTHSGTKGVVRVFSPYSHIRLSWQPTDWENATILQLRLVASGENTMIHIHQEKLNGHTQKTEMERYWTHVLEELTNSLVAG